MPVRIREFENNDLSAVLAIQANCPQAAQWQASDYLHLAGDPGGLVLVAEGDLGPANSGNQRTGSGKHEPAGFCALHRVESDAELRNLAVDPECQRHGLGRALLGDAHRRLREAGVRHVYLEVRSSNIAARELYYGVGYRRLLVRTGYYRQPAEDAVILLLKLDP